MSTRDGKDPKQDMLVSIRYRNDLPPPPMPPKLLDIDTGGLSQYLDPSFASNLVKREEPNIEADAEGGMPIDVIGMYAYFEGDESSILAPEIPPLLDPQDEALMLTPEQLKAGGLSVTGGNFLRKTQYISSTSQAIADPLRSSQKSRRPAERKAVPVARDDKENIKKNVQKGFDLAYPQSATGPTQSTQAEKQAWSKPVHPDKSKQGLTPVAYYPILPDLDAPSGIGASYVVTKFAKPPLPAINNRRDDRIDAAFFAATPHPDRQAQYEAALAAYEKDPDNYEHPGEQPMMWSLAIPKEKDAVHAIRTLFDQSNPDNENDALLNAIGERSMAGDVRITLERARFYTNYKVVGRADPMRQLVISLRDPSKSRDSSRGDSQGPAAYYYPLGVAMEFKSDRAKVAQNSRLPVTSDSHLEELLPDQYMILPRNPTAEELEMRYGDRATFDKKFATQYARIQKEAELLRANKAADEAQAAEDAGDTTMGDVEIAAATTAADDEMEHD